MWTYTVKICIQGKSPQIMNGSRVRISWNIVLNYNTESLQYIAENLLSYNYKSCTTS